MPAGAMFVYRETTGTETFDTTSWHDEDHDTKVWEDVGTFTKEVGDGVKLLETGKYLALFNEGVELSAVSDRSTQLGRLTLGGTLVDGSYCSDFYRGSQGCDECFPSGGCIFDATADDILKTSWKAGSLNSDPQRMANTGGLQVLKLDDDWPYCIVSAAHRSIIQDKGDDINWYTTEEIDSAVFTNNGTSITLQETGWYLCCYSLFWTNNSSPPVRGSCEAYIQLSGIPTEDVEQSFSFGYCRVTSGAECAVTAQFLIYNSTINRTITLKTGGGGGGGTFGLGNDCHMQLAKLPDTINKVDVYDGTGGQNMDVSDTPFDWPDEDFDDDAFDHSVASATDNIVVKKPGPFLFFANFFGDRPSTSGNRFNTLAKFRRKGTALQYGNFGAYNRGDPGSNAVEHHGQSHGIMFPWLTVDDVIELAQTDTSTSSTGDPATVADQMGMQGVYLPSIFPGYWQNGGFFAQQISGVT